ncbi:MAG: hypothetical protein JWM41_3504 [Gemmatimonadetes bacterium]|nr:hypothetical protein [Gemmatimonadota bacterium]
MLYQVISMIGALLILVAYAGSQAGRIDRRSTSYNALNLVGSALLAWVAIVNRQAGFIVLESLWALLSIQPLLASMRKTA